MDIQNRRKSVESYLLRQGCTGLRYERDREDIFSVSLNNHRCQLWIAQEWIEFQSEPSIDERLNRLEVIRFMQHNSLAWVGLKAGKEVIQKIPPDLSSSYGLDRQLKSQARHCTRMGWAVKKLLDSRITAPVTVHGRTGV
jgi:hypothetical protein